MKKIYLLIALSFVIGKSFGQLIFEPFNYTPHPTDGLWTQSAGVWQTVNSGDSILVTGSSLNYSGLQASTGNKIAFDASGKDYYRDFTSQTSGSIYRSFILNVSSLGTLTTTGGYFTGFMQSGSTSLFGGVIWVRLSTTAGRFNVGVSTRSSSSPVSWLAADLLPGTPCFIVASYDIVSGTANDVSRIWLNTSAIGGTEPAADATAVSGTSDISSAARVFFRQDNANNTPFIEIDELRVGTTWADVTPGGAVPSLTISSPLTAFGNVCINTTAGPNSFTISGTNLSTANITVGALAGFTYSTTSGGTYTASLNLTQPGGAYTQQVFVNFDPTAVQSYNGNIAVGGGGATSVNAAASGDGVNTIPLLATGAATAITQTSATAAGTISATGCTAVTAYGIEYSTTAGFANGTGTAVPSTNLAAGSFTSALSGLASSTTYYYHAYATNTGGTGYGAEQSFTTASPNPTINVTSLTAFGNVCTNTTAGPNSFTISGSNLTTANVTVGALAGFTYSTTAGGTYTASLSLAQPGGVYSQQVFVRFTPTAVQSYSGNIPVDGGGVAAPVNVAAAGAGINSAPSVTTGTPATGITQTTATAPGSITATGCTAVTAYGIEYSTTSGFANGSGTQVVSTNLAAGNFTSALSGLTAATTYYYKAYATNGGGTTYGTQQSFTSGAPVLAVTALTPFGSVCVNTTTGPNSFTITGTGLTNANVAVGALAGYTYSTTSGGTYTTTLNLTQPGGAYSQTIFVKFTPTAVQSYNGNIPVTGGGSLGTTNVAAVGSGVNTLATVVTGSVASSNNHSAVLNGSIASVGCSNVTTYGIEYSGISGFLNGNGTQVPSNNVAGGNFSSTLNGLVQGATYYFKAYATNAGGTSYGLQQTFTVASIPQEFKLYPSPVERGTEIRITTQQLITPGYYGLLFYNTSGQLVFQKNMNIQVNFINQAFTIPATLQPGIYSVNLVNFKETIGTRTILVQ